MSGAMDVVERRASHAVEGILNNEGLTSQLDDAAAKVLLDWGTACVKAIARSTAGLEDIEAEDVMSPRLRATRRLMRSINGLIGMRQAGDAERSTALLDRVVEQAIIIYGEAETSSGKDLRDALLELLAKPALHPAQTIASLRSLIESSRVTRRPVQEDEENEVLRGPDISSAVRHFGLGIRDERQKTRPAPVLRRFTLKDAVEHQETDSSCVDRGSDLEDKQERRKPPSTRIARAIARQDRKERQEQEQKGADSRSVRHWASQAASTAKEGRPEPRDLHTAQRPDHENAEEGQGCKKPHAARHTTLEDKGERGEQEF